MSWAQLKDQAAHLEAVEQRKLIAFLVSLQTARDQEFRGELTRKIGGVHSGVAVPALGGTRSVGSAAARGATDGPDGAGPSQQKHHHLQHYRKIDDVEPAHWIALDELRKRYADQPQP